MDIKPIETVYNGYRFRSRLEARWAVFFDSARIPYEYEIEGYRLSDGSYYLPDFYLPWFHAFVEIKPKGMDAKEKAIAEKKCELLFHKEGIVVLLCEGDPADCKMRIFCNELDDDGGGCGWEQCSFMEGPEGTDWDGCEFGFTKHCIIIAVGNCTDYKEREYLDSSYSDCGLYQRCRFTDCRSDLSEYAVKARQARFEHGESPGGGEAE